MVSERQWRDVIGILKVRAGILDLEYLRKWASELDVIDLLEKALSDSVLAILLIAEHPVLKNYGIYLR